MPSDDEAVGGPAFARSASWASVAYSSLANRRYLRRRGMRVTIPRRSNERRRGRFDKATYRLRNVIERLIGLMKHNRRLATRYEKRAEFYRAMWIIGALVC